MEQAKNQLPQQYMIEILRLHSELKKGGFTQEDMALNSAQVVIGKKLIFTDTLSIGDMIIAEADRIDPRSLTDIKAAAESEKLRIQEQAIQDTAKVDEVIAVLPDKLAELAQDK